MKNNFSNFKSGFVSIIGKPNVGKSTLLNRILGEKISIVTNKPQTTRNKVLAVLTEEDCQIIFIDTPGIHSPKSKLGEYMLKSAERSMEDMDLIIQMIDFEGSNKDNEIIKSGFKNANCPVFLVINKIDSVEKEKIMNVINTKKDFYDYEEVIPISALNGDNVETLIDLIKKKIPYGPKYYEDDTLTDQPERHIVSEIIREKALILLDEEVPHGIAVIVTSMKKRENRNIIDIDATIFCEKDSHKGIIIGKKGDMLKKIGQNSRIDIENFLDSKVFLQLWVKIKNNWRNNSFLVKNMGYNEKNI